MSDCDPPSTVADLTVIPHPQWPRPLAFHPAALAEVPRVSTRQLPPSSGLHPPRWHVKGCLAPSPLCWAAGDSVQEALAPGAVYLVTTWLNTGLLSAGASGLSASLTLQFWSAVSSTR